MIAYYEFTKDLRDFLQADADINSVKIGDIDEVDIKKQTIFPFANILITNAEFIEGMVRFDVEVAVMDVVDIRKDNEDVLPADERWKGQDNKQDVLNTMLSVIERLKKHISKGTLQGEGYELQSHGATPFEARFENLLTGWNATMVVDIPNNVQNC
jgi:hypothetical protein